MDRRLLVEKLRSSEPWLVQRTIAYARAHGYTRYTSTLEEAWRRSIAGLTDPLIQLVAASEVPRELHPDVDYTHDPATDFGILQARRHRERGVSIGMFLGLLKYYRQAYLDLCDELGWPEPDTEEARAHVSRFFDRLEVGFCAEWLQEPVEGRIAKLQDANRRMTNEKNKYLTLFESVGTPIFLFDDHNQPSNLNHAAARLLEDAATPGAAYYVEHSRAFGLPWLTEEVARFAETGKAEEALEKEVYTPDGRRCFDVRFKAMLDVSGKFNGTTAVLFELTTLRRAQDESAARAEDLSRANEELVSLNRKLEVAQNQLVQSEKMACIGQLAAGVAHEISNPVSAIHSNLGSLQRYLGHLGDVLKAYGASEQALPPACQAALATAKADADFEYVLDDLSTLVTETREGIRRVTQIVQSLRRFSHPSQSAWQSTDLRVALDSTLHLLRHDLEGKATVTCQYGDTPLVECRPSDLNQVFTNVLVNAAQAIPDHGTITVRTGCVGEEVWAEIQDSGAGIAPENLDRIFEPFFTTKPVGEGTGLGLALSLRIIDGHHGRIEVESGLGAGTTFRIWLPLRQPPADEPCPRRRDAAPAPCAPRVRAGGQRLVDVCTLPAWRSAQRA